VCGDIAGEQRGSRNDGDKKREDTVDADGSSLITILCRLAIAVSLVTQGDHRIHTERAARGNIRRGKRHEDQQSGKRH
jgi:hypothetical protein